MCQQIKATLLKRFSGNYITSHVRSLKISGPRAHVKRKGLAHMTRNNMRPWHENFMVIKFYGLPLNHLDENFTEAQFCT